MTNVKRHLVTCMNQKKNFFAIWWACASYICLVQFRRYLLTNLIISLIARGEVALATRREMSNKCDSEV